MLKRFIPLILLLLGSMAYGQSHTDWPRSMPWWKANNLRVIQFNMPAYEAATMQPDSIVEDLQRSSANTLLINIGGIMAFYPTKLDFHYQNPYLRSPTLMDDLIQKCHQQGIRVMVRFDFSRVHESIFKAHPDWCYLSPKGERVYNTDMVMVSINAPYVQTKAFEIIAEVMDRFPIDGIFLNMPGYQVNNPYEGVYHGIDQNEHDQKRFAAYSQGLRLPVKENKGDSVYKVYEAFKKYTVDDWTKRLHELIKSKNPQVALCTYMDEYVDIIRHESQSSTTLPYWPYTASDNVNNAVHSYPDHIISNASIQQISFQSRYNAVEPEEVKIRLYENIANGSGLDISMMGDMRGYEDERNFKVIRQVYAHHKAYEKYFGRYRSVARIALIAPGSWPSGLPMQEYRGLQLMLKEAHLPFDIIEDSQLARRVQDLKNYRVLLLPDLTYLSLASVEALKQISQQGTSLLATNRTLSDNPVALAELFGAKVVQGEHDGSGFYLTPERQAPVKRFPEQKMLFWKFNLGLYDFSTADTTY
ncbi:alpha-amylase family protein [Siphonobacter sp.]|uniref:alpha-amylase family protein n=1 Tax=Siphonobacter sp. TaxID=1869184 RepID=UPI003B3ABC95